jgi:orotidine-5'-phosphate decarboxylase
VVGIEREKMPTLNSNLSAAERIVPAIDTSDRGIAETRVAVAKRAGAWVVKFGLQYSSGNSWRDASYIANEYDVDWIADAKLYDIPNTLKGTVNNFMELPKPPVGITISTKSGTASLKAAQQIAGAAGVVLFGVGELTSIDRDESVEYEHAIPSTVVIKEACRADEGGIEGVVCSGREVSRIKHNKRLTHMLTLVTALRSKGIDKADQARVTTPGNAAYDGADLLVMGRQIFAAPDPSEAYAKLVTEISEAIESRRQSLQAEADGNE